MLRPGQKDLDRTQEHINILSVKGLRTLMLGRKILTEEEYNRWNKSLLGARSIIGEEKKEAVSKCYE